ncbi:hypothetical protein WGA93_06460 [Escherichia coli]
MRGITLNSYADEESRFDLFERINTGSKVANPAEVRRGALRGEFMNMVIELANSELFRKIAPVSKNRKIKENKKSWFQDFLLMVMG